jgi:hypothetical protein
MGMLDGLELVGRIVTLRSRIKALAPTHCPNCGAAVPMPTQLIEQYGMEAFMMSLDLAERFVSDLERERRG